MYKFERLEVWHESVELIKVIYVLCKNLPFDERDNLIDQLKRSATSVSLNIAEGSGSQNDREYKRYLYIDSKSLFEVVAVLKIIKFLYHSQTDSIEERSTILLKRLSALINKLN